MIVATILLAIFTWAVVVFGLRSAQTRQDVNRTLPALMTFGVLALLTAFFALGDYLDAVLPGRLDAVSSQAEIDALALEAGEPLLIVGEVASQAEYHVSETLDIALEDGEVLVNGSGFLAGRWDEHTEGAHYLDPGSPVVIVARPATGNTHYEARIVFQGTLDEFREYMPRFAIVPMLTMLLSILLALICFGLPVWYRRRIAARAR